MRTALFLIALNLFGCQLVCQAPRSANLWRVTAAALTEPPALQYGPTGAAWNPAAEVRPSELAAAIDFLQTPNVIGLSSVLFGATRAVGTNGRIGVVGGRTEVRDLVRTTSSPTSQGSIPVFEQFLGATWKYAISRFALGGSLMLHHERFDYERDHGFTMDFGVRYRASSRVAIAAATHFLPIELSGREATDYYAGFEYLAAPHFSIGSVAASLAIRYGVTYSAAERWDHMLSGGLDIGGHFGVDASLVREAGIESAGWRPAVSASVLLGRYRLGMARSSGLNELGATYRIGLDVVVFQ